MSLKQKGVLSQVTQIFVVGYTLRSYTVYEGEGPNRFSRRTCFGHELSRWISQAVINRSERMLARTPSRRTMNRMMPDRLMDYDVNSQKRNPALELKKRDPSEPGPNHSERSGTAKCCSDGAQDVVFGSDREHCVPVVHHVREMFDQALPEPPVEPLKAFKDSMRRLGVFCSRKTPGQYIRVASELRDMVLRLIVDNITDKSFYPRALSAFSFSINSIIRACTRATKSLMISRRADVVVVASCRDIWLGMHQAIGKSTAYWFKGKR
ncbi:GL14192 [Drosophila persimilis]|uniref:GL14192 n=1 Tax=Drosophila persimilis TaxID=7234 RepID=B4GTX6_DROPE|nr:GL14192 [Drosophila persimilis]